MNRTSVFNIKIDFDKSLGSYVFDKNTNKYYLDFMGMYSSLPIGYNHPIFDSKEFKEEIHRVSKLKMVNCEMLSDEFDEFYKTFKKFTSMGKYENYHFTCTGALANEAAVKTAMWYKGPRPDGYVLSIKNSFHGINSVGNIITSRFPGVKLRQGDIPGEYNWPVANTIKDAISHVQSNPYNLQGVIIEPIQATYGDNYLNKKELQSLSKICKQFDIPLIFDEVQTGFLSSGTVWYSTQLKIEPDIIVYGKKSQVSGIMVKKSHSKVFENQKRLSVTYDGDLVDMIRCKYIINTIDDDQLKKNVNKQGKRLFKELNKLSNIHNIRQTGLLIAFDFKTTKLRDDFCSKLFSNKMICNPTGTHSVRMRPNLAVNSEEINMAIDIIKLSLN
jgi:L-lysine 6-transaminase